MQDDHFKAGSKQGDDIFPIDQPIVRPRDQGGIEKMDELYISSPVSLKLCHVKYIGVNQTAGTRLENFDGIRRAVFQFAAFDIKQLHRPVPVPGGGGFSEIIQFYPGSDIGKIRSEIRQLFLPAFVMKFHAADDFHVWFSLFLMILLFYHRAYRCRREMRKIFSNLIKRKQFNNKSPKIHW